MFKTSFYSKTMFLNDGKGVFGYAADAYIKTNCAMFKRDILCTFDKTSIL